MVSTGSLVTRAPTIKSRENRDHYPTPHDVTEALITAWKPPEGVSVWEPAVGRGDITKPLQKAGYSTYGTDIFDYGYNDETLDFLTCDFARTDCIVTNPPYAIANDFVKRCLDLDVSYVALLLKAEFWHGKRRYNMFKNFAPSAILPLTWRPDFLGKGSPFLEVSWVIWDKNFIGETIYRPLLRPSTTT